MVEEIVKAGGVDVTANTLARIDLIHKSYFSLGCSQGIHAILKPSIWLSTGVEEEFH
jgi:hypothetical protein